MSRPLRWTVVVVLLVAAAAGVAGGIVLRASKAQPGGVVQTFATWKAGERPAPPIVLRAADGAPFSLASLRGRPVVVTFVDPHCTTFCPRESIVINDALRTLSPAKRPAVVAVSVDPTDRSESDLLKQAHRFRWLPQWRWATGGKAQLSRVWQSYGVTVVPTKGDITHTELAYVLDRHGDERALLLWPFRSVDVSRALATATP